jgi:hypothetical protein
MRLGRIRILKRKARKFFKLLFELLLGKYPINEKAIRQENINYIFQHTIYWMKDVEKEYDETFKVLKDHQDTKHITYLKLSN